MTKLTAALRYYRMRSSWLGDGGQPVPALQSTARAFRCTLCELNSPDYPIWEGLTAAASQELRQQIQLKHELNLTTPHDRMLHICEGCWCLNTLKVHVPLSHILATTDLSKLHKDCWILSEAARTKKST